MTQHADATFTGGIHFQMWLLCVMRSAARAVRRAAEKGSPFPLKRRDAMVGYLLAYMAGQGPMEGDLLRIQVMAMFFVSFISRCQVLHHRVALHTL